MRTSVWCQRHAVTRSRKRMLCAYMSSQTNVLCLAVRIRCSCRVELQLTELCDVRLFRWVGNGSEECSEHFLHNGFACKAEPEREHVRIVPFACSLGC